MTEVFDAKRRGRGLPTLNNGLFPTVADFLCYMRGLKPQNKIGAAFGSYGWSGEAVKLIENELTDMKIELARARAQGPVRAGKTGPRRLPRIRPEDRPRGERPMMPCRRRSGDPMKRPVVELSDCIRCEVCARVCPQVFRMNQAGFVEVVGPVWTIPKEEVDEAIKNCPADCIRWEDE